MAYALQFGDTLDWIGAGFQSVLCCNQLDLTHERQFFRISHISTNFSERDWVDAERLRIGERVDIRRWLISFR